MSGLASAVDELAAADLTAAPLAAVADELVELFAVQARLDAQITRRIGHLDRGGVAAVDGASSTGAWLVGVARIGRAEAHGRVAAARVLHRGVLPGTAAALRDGRISFGHVRALVAASEGVDPDVLAEAEPILVEAAGRLDPGQAADRRGAFPDLGRRAPARPRPRGAGRDAHAVRLPHPRRHGRGERHAHPAGRGGAAAGPRRGQRPSRTRGHPQRGAAPPRRPLRPAPRRD